MRTPTLVVSLWILGAIAIVAGQIELGRFLHHAAMGCAILPPARLIQSTRKES